MNRRIERFLAERQYDGAAWLAVAFACGIAAWFALPRAGQWVAFIGLGLFGGVAALKRRPSDASMPLGRIALGTMAAVLAAGVAHVWMRSELVGTPGIARPFAGMIEGRVLSRIIRPADGEWRLVLATRDPLSLRRVIRVRLRVPQAAMPANLGDGARVRVKVRLMPPAPPLLPGGYDFARAAWFEGLAATGVALGPIAVQAAGKTAPGLPALRATLSAHITTRLPGSAGGIAAALASGDRGGIARADEEAMRDAGLSHLLSVSGLHVSAVVAAGYLVGLRLLALWPWLALRLRLPLWAAMGAAVAGGFYTVLTGSEVPTVRSLVGSLLVLLAVALGRDPLSLRLLALSALVVMLAWPEAVIGPSFQLSFAAVLAIVALHAVPAVRDRLAAREEPAWQAGMRRLGGLLLTGLVIELALLPIGLFHFHRAGLLGALANVVAIPLTTFVIMPAVALALALDLVGLGAPAWWCAGQALALLLRLAHGVAEVPAAVALTPAFGPGPFLLLLGGGLWLALWPGPVRRWGLLPIALGGVAALTARAPDVLVSNDGRHVAVTGLVPGHLAVLRDPRPGFAQDRLNEMAGLDTTLVPLTGLPQTTCNTDFCSVVLQRRARSWHLLLARGSDPVPLRDLAAACERVDLVIAPRWLPASCRPRWRKIDRHSLAQTGGVAIDLLAGRIETVRRERDDHGWQVPPPTLPAGRTDQPVPPRWSPAAPPAAQW
ncbi:ComEC/Rec2 family competence protein [Novosphingobium piscinae]|uniref:ComEC/Rec2 family competence protein n=1 Tax=Novosphingobium piscinae TaxID=1507448 RepID=A0A7X1G0C1_9SPHN|nr:ComEC/Rec2 family competence protein [Novosphingobium piscinae]MBC2669637.1 ComEC/Rec2 family competence protein [Novosphingobium piscinae]